MSDHRTDHAHPSDHARRAAEGRAAKAHAAAHEHEGPHASDRTYAVIAVVLAVITAVETWTFFEPRFAPILIPFLLTLSAVKFGLVAAYFMHLKFDSRLFTGLFCFGLAVAAATIVSLIALFKGLW
jgi:cytochrome c oxidase subunit IV